MTKHTITLQVALNLEPIEDVSLAEIEHHLQWSVLRDRDEGRYQLHVEQLQHSLNQCVSSAIRNAIIARDQKRYAGQFYSRGETKTAKWYYTAQRAYRRVKWWLYDTIGCEIK